MRNPNQLVIEGALPTYTEIDEAMDAMRQAIADMKRAKVAFAQAKAILLQRMMTREVASYDHTDPEGGQWVLELALPEQPGVKIKYLGKYDSE